MPKFKITQREYEYDKWIDNDDDIFEENYYDDIKFEEFDD